MMFMDRAYLSVELNVVDRLKRMGVGTRLLEKWEAH
jgi:hypothetical protein